MMKIKKTFKLGWFSVRNEKTVHASGLDIITIPEPIQHFAACMKKSRITLSCLRTDLVGLLHGNFTRVFGARST
jgi:hypothetical protein